MRKVLATLGLCGLLLTSLGLCPQPHYVLIGTPSTQYAVGATVPFSCFFTTNGVDSVCFRNYVLQVQCVSHSFSFGNSDSARADSVYVYAHTFDAAGTYDVRLFVTDSVSTDEFVSDTLSIVVGGPQGIRDLLPGDVEYVGHFFTGAAAGDVSHNAITRADLFAQGAPSNMFYTQTGDNTADGYPGLLWMEGLTCNGQPVGPFDKRNGVLAINCGGKVAAMKIPIPVLTNVVADIPVADVSRPMQHVAWDDFNMTVGGQQHCDGLWVDERNSAGIVTSAHTIYTNSWDYYNSDTASDDRPTLVQFTLSDTTSRGTVHWGPHDGGNHKSPNFANKYVRYSIQGIPQTWINTFLGGGKWIAGGNGGREGGYSNCHVAPVWPVADEGRIFAGNGPSLGMIRMPTVFPDSGATIEPLKTLLCYNNRHRVEPHLPPIQGAAGDTLNDMDIWHGGAWVETGWGRGLIYLVHKCVYDTHYNCDDPDGNGGTCKEHNRGFKCGDENVNPEPCFENRLYCYAIGDIEAVANGNKQFWEIQPIWRINLGPFFLPYSCPTDPEKPCFTCQQMCGGMAYDEVRHLLFIAQGSVSGAAGGDYDPSSLIHVWRIAESGVAGS